MWKQRWAAWVAVVAEFKSSMLQDGSTALKLAGNDGVRSVLEQAAVKKAADAEQIEQAQAAAQHKSEARCWCIMW